ncbi:Methyltransferase [Chitinispirillum alkaliphilum]|nr:Methyltransferase [Chitinispirillum alkaliphilum]
MQYEALAPVYDRLMSHVNYNEWLELIERVIKKYSLKNCRIFEIGAGTGTLGHKLRKKGFNYTGSDLSFNMCRVANHKRSLPLCCCDSRNLALKNKFDLVIFLYDGINYLHAKPDYTRLFNQVSSILSHGGFFLFDITTQINSRRYFREFTDFEEYDDFSLIRHSYFNEINSIQHNDFTIFKRSESQPELFHKYKESHRQKIFSVEGIEKMIPRNLFQVVGIYDQYSFKRYNSRSERVHFLLRKSDAQ